MKRHHLKDYYVLSLRFDGNGKGFAIGFDSEYSAYLFARLLMIGFADVVTDYQLEQRYPSYFHQLISNTD